jgi:hypothetical protein
MTSLSQAAQSLLKQEVEPISQAVKVLQQYRQLPQWALAFAWTGDGAVCSAPKEIRELVMSG